MPAKAGIQNYLKTLDSRLRGNDGKGRFETFYETIKIRTNPLLILTQLNASFIQPNQTFQSFHCPGKYISDFLVKSQTRL